MIATNEKKKCRGKIDSVRKASLVCMAVPHSGPRHVLRMSVLAGFRIKRLEKTHELFVGTSKTVRYNRVYVNRGSTVHSKDLFRHAKF